ncbi:MAG: 6-bladed beta-propeller [Tannerella sp.]|jgi:hypothetical protein|nr:6-bladed beta-propeller [Tannerella sp.]
MKSIKNLKLTRPSKAEVSKWEVVRLYGGKAFPILCLALVSLLASCSHKTTIVKPAARKGIVSIPFAEAADKVRPAKLSEIADSVAYLPLETCDSSFIRSTYLDFMNRYIYGDRKVFNWKGKYLCTIGHSGQGPGEDGIRMIAITDDAFYSLGDKLVKYDTTGVYAGLETRYMNEYESPVVCPLEVTNAGNKHIAIFTGDTLYFFNSDLNIVKAERVVPPWPERTMELNRQIVRDYFTDYDDSVLFYNYANDTIYRLLDNSVSPRWVMDLGKEKLPLKYVLGDENRIFIATFNAYEGRPGADYYKLTDNKIHVHAVYETPDFLIIEWRRFRDYAELRHLAPLPYQTAYYNKRTGQCVAVKGGDGFIDDLGVLGHFRPLGTHGDYMIRAYWPFELRKDADSLQHIGKTVDPHLVQMLDTIHDDSNPVLVMVHLKMQKKL